MRRFGEKLITDLLTYWPTDRGSFIEASPPESKGLKNESFILNYDQSNFTPHQKIKKTPLESHTST